MSRPGFAGENLRVARMFHGLAQAELGEAVGVTHTFIGQLEAGARRPAPLVVEALASVLGVGPAFFAAPFDDVVRDEECHLRRRHATPVSAKSRVLAHATLFASLIAHLEESVELPAEDLPEGLVVEGRESIEAAAAECRRRWGLDPDLPITNLTRVLERAGVVVTRWAGPGPRIGSLSRVGRRQIVVLDPGPIAASRARFELAHEAGHVVLHRGAGAEPAALEEQAEQFAAALLLPRAGMLREFPRGATWDWDALFALKRRFGASLAALARRAYDLSIIDAARYQRAYKQMSARGWTKGEPHEPEPESPEVVELAFAELGRQGTTPLDVARRLAWSPAVFERVAGIALPSAEIVSLDERRAARAGVQLSLFD